MRDSTEQPPPAAPPPGTESAEPVPMEALGRTTGRGATWVMSSQILGKLATSIAQVFLGWLLTDEDFGLFAAATSFGFFISVMRDGGATSLLVQRGPKEYETLAGPLFWMTFWFNAASAMLLAMLAFPIQAFFAGVLGKPMPGLAVLLLVISASLPIVGPALFLQNKLKIDLRFEALSRITFTSGILRQVSTVALAYMGFGALSLAIPYVLCALYEWWASVRVVRDSVWSRPAKLPMWRELFSRSKWAMIGTIANLGLDQGPYLVLTAMLPKGPVGVFYFAFQMTAQLGVVIGFAVQQVLFPVFARLNDEPERQREAIIRCLHATMLVGCGVSVAFGVGIDALERVVWHGKWQPAVLPMMILALFYPWRISFGLTTAAFQGQGRFKRLAFLTGLEGFGLMVATAIGALVSPTPVGVAWATGLSLFVGRFAITLYMLRLLNTPVSRCIEALFPSWLLAGVAGFAAVGLDRFARPADHLIAFLQPRASSFLPASLSQQTIVVVVESIAHACRGVLMVGVCVLLFGVGARLLLAHHIRDLLGVMPARVRGLAFRLAWMKNG